MTSRYPEYVINIYDGWFNDTLPTIEKDAKFPLVHIGCDLYESTNGALDYFFQHNFLMIATRCLFDDCNCNRASPNFGERRASGECLTEYDVKFIRLWKSGIAGHKMILHD